MMASTVPVKRGVVKPRNRKTKVNLIFDEKKRKEYLTGFRKRKAERKRHYDEKLKKEITAERKRLQSELREKIKKSASRKGLPELDKLIEEETKQDETDETIDLPEHTVTIEHISDTQYRDENVFLGNNETDKIPSEQEISTLAEKKKLMKELNRKTQKKLKKTKAFKRQVQAVRDKSRKRSKASKKGKSKGKGKK